MSRVRGEEEAEGDDGYDADHGLEAFGVIPRVDYDEGGHSGYHDEIADAAGKAAAEDAVDQIRKGTDYALVDGVAKERL